MNRKALVRRIGECLFNEPVTRRGAGGQTPMRFTHYPKGEAYQVTPRKLAAARRAVPAQKDRSITIDDHQPGA
jgi:hypothetical protein